VGNYPIRIYQIRSALNCRTGASKIENLHSGIAILLEYREIHKQLTTFIEGWKNSW